jgi:hypothetical protein
VLVLGVAVAHRNHAAVSENRWRTPRPAHTGI